MSAEDKSDFEPFDRRLTMAFLAPPTVWLVYLSVSYALVPEACTSGTKAMLHVATLVALLLAAVPTVFAFHRAREAGRGSLDRGEPHETRRRTMAIGSVVYGVAFTLLIVATAIPTFILRSCD